MLKSKALREGDVVDGQYVILEKIDRIQHSSKIYKGWDSKNETFVVIKISSLNHKEKNKQVTKILHKLRGGTGIPNIIWRGVEDNHTITVTDCLGPNLKKLFYMMDKRFTIPTISTIALKLLHTLEYIHNNDYVCCNIMPKEILISLNKKNQNLYITDFKQAKKVKKGHISHEDVSHSANKLIVNKFSSISVHIGLPPTKKDDLESLGYILLYFFKQGEVFEKNPKYDSREEKLKHYETQKLLMVPELFTAGLPTEMTQYIAYVKTLQFSKSADKPDYEYLRKLFRNLYLKTCTNPESFEYDWIQHALYKLNATSSKPSEKGSLAEQTPLISFGDAIPMSYRDFTEDEPSINSPSLHRNDDSHNTVSKTSSTHSSFALRSRQQTSSLKFDEFSKLLYKKPSDEETDCNLDEFDEFKPITFSIQTICTSQQQLISDNVKKRTFHSRTMSEVKITSLTSRGGVTSRGGETIRLWS